MFARVMAVVMAAILIMTAVLSAVSWITLRDRQIDARLDYLISEAEDIAYLAGNLNGPMMDGNWYRLNTRTILNRKAEKVYGEFGAYIAVVDHYGNMMDNARTAYSEDPEFIESLSNDEITEALNKIMGGETIRIRSDSGEAPTFTVGVPFMNDGKSKEQCSSRRRRSGSRAG